MRILATLAVAASAIGVSAAAYDVVLVAPPVSGPLPFIGDHPAVTATEDGFAVAWDDIELTGPYELAGRLRFARYDAAGHRVVDSGRLPVDLGELIPLSSIRLAPSRDGFAVFLGNDAYQILSGSIGADGTMLRAPQPIIESVELYPYDVAPGPGGDLLLTYPEWLGTWQIWAVPLGGGATPSGPRSNVVPAVSAQDLVYRFIDDAPVAAVGSGFATAWMEGKVGVRTRELTTRGAPAGPVSLVAGMAACPASATIASVGASEAIVYSAGCAQTDLFLATRPRAGPISAPVQLTFEPVDEGSKSGGYAERNLRAVGGSATVEVLYSIVVPLDGGGFTFDWALAEFDLAGNVVAPPTLLNRDLGIVPYSTIDLAWDGRRNRFLLAWEGDGPQGPGVYVMGVPSAR